MRHSSGKCQKADVLVSQTNQMRIRFENRVFKIEVNERESLIVLGAPNHHKRVVMFAQEFDAPIVQGNLHENETIRVHAATQFQQARRGERTGHETKIVFFVRCPLRDAGDEIHFNHVREQARVRERIMEHNGARFTRCQTLGLEMRNIAQFVNDSENLLARFVRDIILAIDDARDRHQGNAGFFGDILQGRWHSNSLAV